LRSTLALRGVRQASTDVLACQLREFGEDLIFRRTCGQVPKQVANSDSSPAHTGFAEADLRIDADSIEQAHDDASLRQFENEAKRTTGFRLERGKPGGKLATATQPVGGRNPARSKGRDAILFEVSAWCSIEAFDLRLAPRVGASN
jgi:hypothetical protein